MTIFYLVLIIVVAFALNGAGGRLSMHLFTKRIATYSVALLFIIVFSFLYYTAILVCGTLIAFIIHPALGIVVGIALLIGTIGVGYRNLLREAHHSLSIARDRRQ